MLKTWRNNFEWEGVGRPVLYLTDLGPGGFEARKVIFRGSVSVLQLLVASKSKQAGLSKPGKSLAKRNATFVSTNGATGNYQTIYPKLSD